MYAVEVLAQFLKLLRKCVLIVRHVQESLRRGIDEAVLLPDREHVALQAELFEGFVADAAYFDALRSADVREDLVVVVENVADFLHLLVAIATVLITEQLVKCLQLIELQYAVMVQVCCHEDLLDVLQLLSL